MSIKEHLFHRVTTSKKQLRTFYDRLLFVCEARKFFEEMSEQFA